MLRHGRGNVPVTALAFAGQETVISGQGHFLRAYCVADAKQTAAIRAFDDQAVHGIVVCSPAPSIEGIVYGGPLLKHFCYHHASSGRDALFELADLFRTVDWILDAAFSLSSGSNRTLVSLVTAHNALIIAPLYELKCKNTEHGNRILAPVVPGSNLLLYSAHIRWLSASQYLIASGTVFGDVILSEIAVSTHNAGEIGAQVESSATFRAHDGSVFGVQISPLLNINGTSTRVLATCSDDRSVRVWDIRYAIGVGASVPQRRRVTGFGTSSNTDEFPHLRLATAMGHVSRVWQVKFLESTELAGDCVHLLSFGEDASNVTWRLARNPTDGAFALCKMQVDAAHSGKHIWSSAISSAGAVATGGADAAIVIRIPAPESSLLRIFNGTLLGREIDKLKTYSFADDHTLAGVTEEGSVVTVTLDFMNASRVSKVSPPLRGLPGFSLMASVSGVVFIAGTCGIVYAYVHWSRHVREVCRLQDRKMAGLFAAAETRRENDEDVVLLATFVGSQTATILRTSISSLLDHDVTQPQPHRWTLELFQGFIVTSFSRVSDCDTLSIAVGSRHGDIAVYECLEDALSTRSMPFASVMEVKSSKEAITSLCWTCGPDDSIFESGYLHSTSRDGTYTIHYLARKSDGWTIETVHRLSLPFGPNIEGLLVTLDHGIIAWGFRNTCFIAHEVITQQDLMTVDCGGAHRTWAFRPSLDGGMFVWTKASQIHCQPQTTLPYIRIHSGGHGREIKAVAASPTRPGLFATGAEDTNIKLWIAEGDNAFRCLHTLRKHNTGLQHLQWSVDGCYLFSSGGFEEFFIWRITNRVTCLDVGVFCESEHPQAGRSDLRIMHFDIVRQHFDFFDVLMAYSNSTLKLWQYRKPDKSWRMIAEGDYLTACLTNVIYISNVRLILTTSNDGYIALWPFDACQNEDQLRWEARRNIHQNAIVSITLQALPNGSAVVATGGDDNALGITHFVTSDLSDSKSLVIPQAHAAAVTGLTIIAPRLKASNNLVLASGSTDQQVKLWRASIDPSGMVDSQCIAHVHAAVADISSLVVIDETRDGDECEGLLVCGVGFEYWTVHHDKAEGKIMRALTARRV